MFTYIPKYRPKLNAWLGIIITAIIPCCCLVCWSIQPSHSSLNFSQISHSLSHTSSFCVSGWDLAEDRRHVLASSVPAFAFIVKRKTEISSVVYILWHLIYCRSFYFIEVIRASHLSLPLFASLGWDFFQCWLKALCQSHQCITFYLAGLNLWFILMLLSTDGAIYIHRKKRSQIALFERVLSAIFFPAFVYCPFRIRRSVCLQLSDFWSVKAMVDWDRWLVECLLWCEFMALGWRRMVESVCLFSKRKICKVKKNQCFQTPKFKLP